MAFAETLNGVEFLRQVEVTITPHNKGTLGWIIMSTAAGGRDTMAYKAVEKGIARIVFVGAVDQRGDIFTKEEEAKAP